MKNYEYIKKSRLKENYRRDYITLNGLFGNRRRIIRKKAFYHLVIFGYREKITTQFISLKFGFSELLKGIALGQTLDHNFFVKGEGSQPLDGI